MPAAPALLKKLRATLGDEATRDLVTWVDQGAEFQVARLRELADLHYSRFDARLEQRLAESEGKLRAELAQGLAAVRSEMAQGLAAVRQDLVQGDASLRTELAAHRADLIKWMFIFWAGTVIPIAGLVIALAKL